MSVTSISPADAPAVAPGRILVWDAPVRVFHWLMVLSFAAAWLTGDSERWRLLHVTLGYTMAGLVAFRLVWGLVGTRHARFASFVRGPAAVARYLKALLRREPEHHVGHNPAGAVAIVALLVLTAATTALGWAAYGELGGEWVKEVHEGAATVMLIVVLVHVAGVVVSSLMHRENLVKAMLTGRKPGAPGEGIRRAWAGVAAVMLLAVAGFWWQQWQSAPAPGLAGAAAAKAGQGGHKHEGKHEDRD
jgi:cytochrome b